MSVRIYYDNAEYIAANPSGLNASTDDHTVNPADQTFVLLNYDEDVSVIAFAIADDASWLSTSVSGSNIPNEAPGVTVTAHFDTSALVKGTYTATITITTAGGTLLVPVALVVEGG